MKLYYNLLFLLMIFVQCNSSAQSTTSHLQDNKVVIVYGSPYCHYCSDLKTALEEKKIAYVFYDIDTNEVALNEMLAKLNKAKMSTNNLRIPVVDKYGVLYVNTIDFKEFIKKVTKK